MPQLHLYAPDATAELLKQKANQSGLTISRYLDGVVVREVGRGEWPEDFFENVLGSWEGELRRAPQGAYEAREDL